MAKRSRASGSGTVSVSPPNTMSLNQLIVHSWQQYCSLSNSLPAVIKGVIPILWFGDLDAYCASPIRIVTVGLNPSNKEFQEKDCDPISVNLRFPAAVSLVKKKQLANADIVLYRSAMNNYFKIKPYQNWFMWNETALNPMNASYGGKMSPNGTFQNTALHIDLKTPIATQPTWGGLCKQCQTQITSQCSTIFHQLIRILQPHVVIVAANRYNVCSSFNVVLNAFNINLSFNKHTGKHASLPPSNPSRSTSYIRTFTNLPNYTLIWAMNYNGSPFGGFAQNDPNKVATMGKIYNYLKSLSLSSPLTPVP